MIAWYTKSGFHCLWNNVLVRTLSENKRQFVWGDFFSSNRMRFPDKDTYVWRSSITNEYRGWCSENYTISVNNGSTRFLSSLLHPPTLHIICKQRQLFYCFADTLLVHCHKLASSYRDSHHHGIQLPSYELCGNGAERNVSCSPLHW